MLCTTLDPLLGEDKVAFDELEAIRQGFGEAVRRRMDRMWAQKLGLTNLDRTLLQELLTLMVETRVDYTIFFRELSYLPETIDSLRQSFYTTPDEALLDRW